MKKLLLIIMTLLIVLVPIISAFEYDNVKQYNLDTKTVEIKNSFNILGWKWFELDTVAGLRISSDAETL
ncbi:unnamed protein product, partial [marine sediment metagenome]